jgi:hypothetical protein
VLGSLSDLAKKTDLLGDKNCFRPLVIEFDPYGVHFSDKLLGADVYYNKDSEQWYNKFLETPLGSLEPCDLERHPAWQLVKRVTECFLDQDVSLPVFGLPVIASVLNVAVNLYSESLLIDMAAEGDAARHDLAVIHELLCTMHRYFIEKIPEKQRQCTVAAGRTQPPGFGQLCGCTTQLVSRNMYDSFIAPLDAEMLALYPHGGLIHLCGSHEQHIPVWRNMKSLRAVQLNDRAAVDLELYFNGLREDQIIYLNPFKGMPIERAIAITGGKRLVIAAPVTERFCINNA